MEATPAVTLPTSRQRSDCFAKSFRVALAALLATLLNVTALTLVLRRSAGALVQPLEPTQFILVILAGAWAAGVARHLCLQGLVTRRHDGPRHTAVRMIDCLSASTAWLILLPSVSLILLLASLAVPGTAARAVAVALAVLAMEELVVGLEVARVLRARKSPSGNPAKSSEDQGLLLLRSHRVIGDLEDSFYQRMVRHRLSGDLDHIEADCIAVFETGQRHAVEHLAFCPPFDLSPDVHCEQVGGPKARIGVIRILPYGARVELRLPAPATERTKVAFRLTATSRAPASAASA